MNKKVTLGELLWARIVLAICIAVYYWCWARNGWEDYFSSIQQCVAIFAFMFFCLLAMRERKYKKENVDEMAAANLKRCDSICYKISMVLIVCIGFTISSEIIGYMLMGVLVLTAIVRTAIFCYMDAKGI